MENKIKIEHVSIEVLRAAEYNPRGHSEAQAEQLKESIKRFGIVDPILVNSAPGRENVTIGGHFRVEIARELGYTTLPVVYINLPDIEKEKELNIRLNKNTGEFNLELLAEFDETFLADIGFDSEELDSIFEVEDTEETFNLDEELERLDITKIEIQKGDVYEIDGSRMMCGDSTIESDVLKLCGDHKVDLILTDPPYRLDYLKGKTRNGKPTEGFGSKKNRKYLETDELPLDFTTKWMENAHKVSTPDSSIICFENWKNIREIWGEMEKHWKVRNMIVWHVGNRNQGYAGSHKLFSKHDIAMVGTSTEHKTIDATPENDELLENEYQTALFAIQGKPHWESYGKDKTYCPTDFIEHTSADEKSSGQAIIFGTKPLPILIPYIKVLTKRDQLVLEPFGGSGSSLIASIKMKRRCFLMEKSPVYAEVIKRRWEMATGKKAVKINVLT